MQLKTVNTNLLEDIIFETQNEYGQSIIQKRSMVFKLLESGLLQDENGKINNSVKSKTLEMLGFGVWDNTNSLDELHTNKAKQENITFADKNNNIEVLEIDDHKIHIDNHIAYMLSGEYEQVLKENINIKQEILEHINTHKKLLNI